MKIHPTALYALDGQMFICQTEEERAALAAAGWTDAPSDFGSIRWVPHFRDVVIEAKKPERVVGADTNGDGVIDQPFKKKPGRPKKS